MAKLEIKGANNILYITCHEGNGQELYDLLSAKLALTPNLFRSSPVQFQGQALDYLTDEEMITLQRLCLDYGMFFPAAAPLREITPPTHREQATPAEQDNSLYDDLTIGRTLRSGQTAHADGTLLIWGDVHEGAEITAGGDIVVLGRLLGIAHAGCFGDRQSIIFALSLTPKQLRIADQFSRAPRKKKLTPELAPYPEYACLDEDGNIATQQYASRKGSSTK